MSARSTNVHQVHPLDARRYARPLLPWVRRRARRLQTVFGLDRSWAVAEAAADYAAFTGSEAARRVAQRRSNELLDRLCSPPKETTR